jgi:transcriptional regulator with XRE-family HTH domain
MSFAQSLKKIIADSGMNQKQFASKSGVTEAAISRYINGSRNPTMDALLKIKNAANCSWEDIMGE